MSANGSVKGYLSVRKKPFTISTDAGFDLSVLGLNVRFAGIQSLKEPVVKLYAHATLDRDDGTWIDV
jgi:hypothetical protein